MAKMFCVIFILISLIHIGSSYQIQPRIVNGSPSSRGDFPFYAFLRMMKRFQPKKRLLCGGTLLNENYILTAAHCLYNTTKVEIHLGSWQRDEIEIGRQIFYARHRFYSIHPNYKRKHLWNDIALIRLPRPAIYTDLIQPVKLPDACDIFNLLNGINLRVIGNGKEKTNGTFPDKLQHTILTTTSQTACKDVFPFIDENKVFCLKSLANDYNQSVCQGDSGGPVVHGHPSAQQILYGITSFTHTSGCSEKPQGFSNIFTYLPWISEITGIQFPVCGKIDNTYEVLDFATAFANS